MLGILSDSVLSNSMSVLSLLFPLLDESDLNLDWLTLLLLPPPDCRLLPLLLLLTRFPTFLPCLSLPVLDAEYSGTCSASDDGGEYDSDDGAEYPTGDEAATEGDS